MTDALEIHPSSIIFDLVRCDSGVIGPFCVLGESYGDDPKPLTLGRSMRLRSHTVVYLGSTIGSGFVTGHGVLVREECIIGDDVSIGSGSILEHHVTLHDRVRVHSRVFIPEFTVCKEDAWIGPGVVFTNAKYPRSKDAKKNLRGAIIERGAKIGAHATILPGIRVGEGALVGAGAVVTKDVPDYAVVVGNPAAVISSISDISDYQR